VLIGPKLYQKNGIVSVQFKQQGFKWNIITNNTLPTYLNSP
jgi:hypothetical protein